MNRDVYVNDMLDHGVVVMNDMIDDISLHQLVQAINQLNQCVLAKIKKLPRPLKTYTDIAERQLGRLDYRCGFKDEIFKSVELPIIEIVKQISPLIDFNHYWGAIPASSGAGPTDLHRDIYPILNTTQGMDLGIHDIQLPPYYLTVLIPLVEITLENGPTEFILGSHKQQTIIENKPSFFRPQLVPGDLLIFDGRTMHRGNANQSKHERQIAYITFTAKWYHDQTFVTNDYLFPELVT